MSDPVPVTFTNLPMMTFAHARRAGERMALCGAYNIIRIKHPESLIPKKPLCKSCEQLLIWKPEGGSLNGS